MPTQAPQWTEFLCCPVCYHQFSLSQSDDKERDRSPISLSCGHTLCQSCLKELKELKSPVPNMLCPFDQAVVEKDVDKLPINTALLQLVGVQIPEQEIPDIADVKENQTHYVNSKKCIEELACFLKQITGNGNGNGAHASSHGIVGNGGALSRPMQRKLVTLVNCQLAKEEGRTRAMRAARSLGERTVTELILLHQNQQQLSANLWAAVRGRGCQFLGPAMQEEALKYILLALEGGESLSRKVLVLFVVQKLEPLFPQASKTSIGHVVQLLYRASCFMVTKRNEDSSLMQLKEQFRTYDALRKEHDGQIVQIATEAGLRISPDQWSSLLYGDMDHKSHMQSIIDKLQSPGSFAQSIQELIIALQRSSDPGGLSELRPHFELLSRIDAQPEAAAPTWEALEEAMKAVHAVVTGLSSFSKTYGTTMRGTNDPPPPHNAKFKTSMCRDLQRGGCPRGSNCTFAHSEDELERFSRGRRQVRRPQPQPIPRGSISSTSGAGPDQYSPVAPAENGTDGSPSGSSLNGSASSSPLCVSGAGPVNITEGPPAYGQPAQMYPRKGPQDQLARGMNQMTIHAPRPVYPEPPNYGAAAAAAPPPYHERMPFAPSPQSDRSYYHGYYGQTPPVTIPAPGPPSQSYTNGVTSGLPSPRCSPLTIQDEPLLVPHENGVHNGYMDAQVRYSRPRVAYDTARVPRRMDRDPHMTQPPSGGAVYSYSSATYAGYPDPYYRGNGGYYYNSRQYEPLVPYAAAHQMRRPVDVGPYHAVYVPDGYRGLMARGDIGSRRPYIPLPDSSADDDADTDSILQSLVNGINPPSKDAGTSSASSGVSSGSSLSQSPSASHSSTSSTSPRQDSPCGWQQETDAIWTTENVTLPQPPALADATWSAWNQREIKKLWPPFGDVVPSYDQTVEQIMKDEEIARGLQQIENGSSHAAAAAAAAEIEANDAAIVAALKNEEEEEDKMRQLRNLDPVKRKQEKDDCDLAMQTQALEDAEAAERKRKDNEYARLLQERRDLIAKQKRKVQEEEDRLLAEQIAFRDAERHGLVRPNTRQLPRPIGYNPNVIPRGPPVDRPFHGNGTDVTDAGEFTSFSGLGGCFRTSCAGSDDVIDASKLAPGCSGDIRVQE